MGESATSQRRVAEGSGDAWLENNHGLSAVKGGDGVWATVERPCSELRICPGWDFAGLL